LGHLDSKGYPYWPKDGAAEWGPIAEIMKKHGFAWGGEWKDFPDSPHYEMADRGKL